MKIVLTSLVFVVALPNADAGPLGAAGNSTVEYTAGFVRGIVKTVKYVPETVNVVFQWAVFLGVPHEQQLHVSAFGLALIDVMHHYTNRWQNLAEEALGIRNDTPSYRAGVFCGGTIVPLILLGLLLRYWTYRVAKKTTGSPSRRNFYWRVAIKMSWRTFLICVAILFVVVGINSAPAISESEASASIATAFLLLLITVPPVVLISARGATNKAFAVAGQ